MSRISLPQTCKHVDTFAVNTVAEITVWSNKQDANKLIINNDTKQKF